MKGKNIFKIKAAIVIALMLLVTVTSITIHADDGYPYTLRVDWLKKYTEDVDENNEMGQSIDIVYDQEGNFHGFIIAGSRQTAGNTEMFIIKTDTLGRVGEQYPDTWDMTIGGSSNCAEALCIQQTDDDGDGMQDDGFIIVGHDSYQLCLIKMDYSGNFEPPNGWVQKFEVDSLGVCVQQTNDDNDGFQDDGYIITGDKDNGIDLDIWIIKTDKDGNLGQGYDGTWERIYDGPNMMNDRGYSVIQTNPSSPNPNHRFYIVTGEVGEPEMPGDPAGPGSNICVLKYDSYGNSISPFPKFFGDGNHKRDRGHSVKETNNDNYILTGTTYENANYKVRLIELSPDGNTENDITYTNENAVCGYSIDVLEDGYIIACGPTITNPSLCMLETDIAGGIRCRGNFYTGTGYSYVSKSVQNIFFSESPGEYMIGGWVLGHGETDVFLTKIIKNSNPTPPDIDGPEEGIIDVEYDFTFVSEDPDEDNVMYIIDWDDETTTETGYYASGVPVELSHTWTERKVYEVTAIAKDIYGAESELPQIHYVDIRLPYQIYYFDDYDPDTIWDIDWAKMIDSNPNSAAKAYVYDEQINNHNSWDGFDYYPIEFVSVKIKAKTSSPESTMIFQPIFDGVTYGEVHEFTINKDVGFYEFDITLDENKPNPGDWSWSDIENLDCIIISEPIFPHLFYQVYCYIVEIIVEYYV